MLVPKTIALAGLLTLTFAGLALAGPLKPTKLWKGSVADEKLAQQKPENGVVTNSKDFEKLVKAWTVADKVPEVDFDKELILVDTTVGSLLNLSATLDDKGDLKAIGIGTRDFLPGFRYVLISVPKEGVKTVNGKPLPK